MAQKAPRQPDDFQVHLDNAMKEARECFARCHQVYKVEQTESVSDCVEGQPVLSVEVQISKCHPISQTLHTFISAES